MKPCYGELKVPNVPSRHSWSADKVKNLCVSSDLYVRAFNPLVIEDTAERELPPPRQDDLVEHQEPGPSESCTSYDDKVCIVILRIH